MFSIILLHLLNFLLKDLKVLKCRNCQLVSISPQLYNYVIHLTELDLGDNTVKYFY